MKKNTFLVSLLFITSLSFSQKLINQNSHELFNPFFYQNNGNEYRSASGIPGPKYWQNRVDYDIDVKLNTENHSVEGEIVMHYTNNSPDPLKFLWVQLDQNLFKESSRGRDMKAFNEVSRFDDGEEQFDGGYTITNFKVSNGESKQLIEDTRMQIRLEKPLAPNGGKLDISMNFSFLIPTNGSDRMGHFSTANGEIYTLAQWFPRMAVYDDVLGWNTHPYLGAGEFYCEYGDVNLKITAPDNHTVFGSGNLMNPKETLTPEQYERWKKAEKSNEIVEIIKEKEVIGIASKESKKTKTWYYRMENTRDVAWSSSKAFVVDAVKINLPSGKDCLAISAQPVESNGKDSYGRGAEYVKGSVENYSNMWYEYPYPLAINIASNQHGMEYPGIVFCGWTAKNERCWGVIDHEFGHTWFPMIVGSNERLHAWMDEGFNTFMNQLSDKMFNNGEYSNPDFLKSYVSRRFEGQRNELVALRPDGIKEYNMGNLLYMKPGYALHLLRDIILGEDRFDYAFTHYINSWAFKHPTPEDFFRCIENAAGEDLSWFWRSWFYEFHEFDQSISNLKKVKGGYTVKVKNLDKMVMPILIELDLTNGEKKNYQFSVDVWMRRTETLIFLPLDEKLEVIKAELDVNQRFPDKDRSNNISLVE